MDVFITDTFRQNINRCKPDRLISSFWVNFNNNNNCLHIGDGRWSLCIHHFNTPQNTWCRRGNKTRQNYVSIIECWFTSHVYEAVVMHSVFSQNAPHMLAGWLACDFNKMFWFDSDKYTRTQTLVAVLDHEMLLLSMLCQAREWVLLHCQVLEYRFAAIVNKFFLWSHVYMFTCVSCTLITKKKGDFQARLMQWQQTSYDEWVRS